MVCLALTIKHKENERLIAMASSIDFSLKQLEEIINELLPKLISDESSDTDDREQRGSQKEGRFRLTRPSPLKPSPSSHHRLSKKLREALDDLSRKLNSILTKIKLNDLTPNELEKLLKECESLAANTKTLQRTHAAYKETISPLLTKAHTLLKGVINATLYIKAIQRQPTQQAQTPGEQPDSPFRRNPYKITCKPY